MQFNPDFGIRQKNELLHIDLRHEKLLGQLRSMPYAFLNFESCVMKSCLIFLNRTKTCFMHLSGACLSGTGRGF